MSHFDPDNLGYFDAIQVFFTEVTGRGVMLGGRDIEFLEQLRQEGADARLVCRGIQEAVAERPEDDPPRNVHDCKDWIEDLLQRAREGEAGAHELDLDIGPASPTRSDAGDSDDASDVSELRASELEDVEANDRPDGPPIVIDALDTVEQSGREARNDAIRRVYRHAWRQIRELLSDDGVDYFESLTSIEDDLVERYYDALDDDARANLDEHLHAEEGMDLERMTAEARERHLLARKRKLLIEHHGFTPLVG